jgi:hypothetical protein
MCNFLNSLIDNAEFLFPHGRYNVIDLRKKGFGFAGVYPDKRCARCVNVAPFARNV